MVLCAGCRSGHNTTGHAEIVVKSEQKKQSTGAGRGKFSCPNVHPAEIKKKINNSLL